MHVPISYVAVIVAAIASSTFGFMWYRLILPGRKVISPDTVTMGIISAPGLNKKGQYFGAFLGNIAMAYIIANLFTFVSAYFQSGDVVTGLLVGLWTWFGFAAPIIFGLMCWEVKLWKRWFFHSAYYFFTFIIMGVIISFWQ